jgi:methylmalonyl-CoA mutase N-terminal domain/subunit
MLKDERFQDQLKKWEASTLKKVTDRFPERKSDFSTGSWLPAERVALPEKEDYQSYMENLGFPGEYPFTRGVQRFR